MVHGVAVFLFDFLYFFLFFIRQPEQGADGQGAEFATVGTVERPLFEIPQDVRVQIQHVEAFYGFLLGRDKLLGTIRNLCFAAALVLLVIGYAVSDGTGGYSIADIANQPYYLIAVGVMVLALLLSLAMIRIEKELPKEMRPK